MVKDIIGDNYFDFGTVGVVRKDHLGVLPGMFRALPCQAPLSAACRGWRAGWAWPGRGSGSWWRKATCVGGFVAIVNSIEIVDEEVKVGLWLVGHGLYISRRFLLPDSLPDDGVDDDSLASGSLLGLPDVVDVDLSLHGHVPATAPPVCNWSC